MKSTIRPRFAALPVDLADDEIALATMPLDAVLARAARSKDIAARAARGEVATVPPPKG
jgi:hypothetical protein